MSSDASLLSPVMWVANYAPKARRVLDVGAGYGRFSYLYRTSFLLEDQPETFCVDIWTPYVKLCQSRGMADHGLVASGTCLPFTSGALDLAFMTEVLEHLSKDDGKKALAELRRVARDVIVSTPNRFVPQHSLDGNPYQVHRSEWKRQDFLRHGLHMIPHKRFHIATNVRVPTRFALLRRRVIPIAVRRWFLRIQALVFERNCLEKRIGSCAGGGLDWRIDV